MSKTATENKTSDPAATDTAATDKADAKRRAAPTDVPQLTPTQFELNTGRIAQPNPWVGVLRQLPADPNKEGWSLTQAFVCQTEDVAGYSRKIRAAGSELTKGVALQTEANDTDKAVKTAEGFELAPGHSVVRFATRAVRQTRKAKADA